MHLADIAVRPDFDAFARCLRRQGTPARVHHAELYLDGAIKLGLAERFGLADDIRPGDPDYDLQLDLRVATFIGHDAVRVHLPASEFRMDVRSSADTGTGAFARTSQGYLVHEHGGPIQNWRDLETYPWPDIARLDTRPLEWADRHLPDGMKAYDLSAQFFECATWLMGYETLFVGIYEDPDLVAALLERIATVYLDYTRLLCQFDCIGAIWGTDDMGYKTQTLVAPDWLREHILPLHRQAAAIAHEHGKLYILHSCGKIDPLVDDLIDEVGIDARHSFEDAATPVLDFHARWGDRVGIVGGIDVDFLARATPEQVRARVRQTLETCHPGGGYVLGSGNSVTDYVPLDNYLALLEEGRRFGA